MSPWFRRYWFIDFDRGTRIRRGYLTRNGNSLALRVDGQRIVSGATVIGYESIGSWRYQQPSSFSAGFMEL